MKAVGSHTFHLFNLCLFFFSDLVLLKDTGFSYCRHLKKDFGTYPFDHGLESLAFPKRLWRGGLKDFSKVSTLSRTSIYESCM